MCRHIEKERSNVRVSFADVLILFCAFHSAQKYDVSTPVSPTVFTLLMHRAPILDFEDDVGDLEVTKSLTSEVF